MAFQHILPAMNKLSSCRITVATYINQLHYENSNLLLLLLSCNNKDVLPLVNVMLFQIFGTAKSVLRTENL